MTWINATLYSEDEKSVLVLKDDGSYYISPFQDLDFSASEKQTENVTIIREGKTRQCAVTFRRNDYDLQEYAVALDNPNITWFERKAP